MTKREKNQRIKEIVKEVLGHIDVRVTSGRGTAYSWWTIILAKEPSEKHKKKIIEICEKEELLSYYWSDFGYSHLDHWIPQLSWEVTTKLRKI